MQARRTFRRIALIVVAIVILVPVAAVGIFVATFDPNSYKPQIVAAVEKLTHRQLTIEGRLRMNLSLVPTISASGITLANPPGYADANFVTLKRIEAQVALLPLIEHRLNILKLVLVDPVINLEYGPTGEPNWLLDRRAGTGGGANGTGAHAQGGKPGIALQSVAIRNGTITYRPATAIAPLSGGQQIETTARPTVLHIARFTGRADSLDAPLHLNVEAQYNGSPFTIAGTTGPVSRLTGASDQGAAWPIDLTVSGEGAKLHATGTIAHPRRASGYLLKLHATIPDLAALAPYLPPADAGMKIPPLKSVDMRAEIAEPISGSVPSINNVSITAGKSDLGDWRKGLSLTSLNVTLPALDQQLNIALAGQYQGRALGLEGKAGPIAPIADAALGLAPGKPAQSNPGERFTVNLAAKVGQSLVNVAGGIATPSKLAGVALKLNATIPDLAKLSDLAGMPLPAWTNIGASALLTDPGGKGLAHAIGLNSFTLSSDQAQLGGAFSLDLGKTPDLQAVVHAPRIDLTALLKAMPKPISAGATSTPANSSTAQPSPPAASNAGQGAGRLIPDTPLPFNMLRTADGNVELTIDKLDYAGATYRAITAHGLLRKGVLAVRPISAELPGGSVSGTLHLDANANPPTMRITEQAPAFRLAPLLKLLGLPGSASATVQLYADLSGKGRTPHDIASNLNGAIGFSTVNGEIDGKLLDRLITDAGLPAGLAGSQGPVQLRCFATRIDAKAGIATLRALTLDSSRLFLTGTGSANLATEGLDILVRPEAQVGSGSTPIPFAITGTFANPSTGIAPAGAYAQTLATLGQHVAGGQGLLGRFAQRLGIEPKAASGQSCQGALALARMGHPGPAPAAASAPSTGSTNASSGAARGPQNLLQSLFH